MRKLLLLWLLVASITFGAVSANTNWDTRPATGSDSANSCGFVVGATGTDFSSQTSPQFTLSGVTSVGAGNIVLTASAVATMVGNIALVTGGTNFNLGRYEITAVSVGVSFTVSTRADGTAITSAAGAAGTINIGGSCATYATPYAAASAGNAFWLKGSLTVTSTLTLTLTPGSGVNATTFRGYTTVHGDCAVNTTCATWTTATNSTNLVTTSAQSGYGFYGLTFSNTAGTTGFGFVTNGGPVRDYYFEYCLFTGFSNAINAIFANQFQMGPVTLFGSEVKNSTGDGLLISGSVSIQYSYIHDNVGAGLEVQIGGDSGTLTTIVGSTFYNNGGNGFYQNVDQTPATTRAISVSNSDFVSNTGAGIRLGNTGNSSYGGVITNSIFYGNSTYGIDYTAAFYIAENRLTNNAFGANTTAAIHNFTGGVGNITLSGDPFNGRTTNDFSLNNTTGAGKLLRGTGYPGATVFGTGTIDVGALQSSAGGGGGGQVGYAIIQ